MSDIKMRSEVRYSEIKNNYQLWINFNKSGWWTAYSWKNKPTVAEITEAVTLITASCEMYKKCLVNEISDFEINYYWIGDD